MTVELGYFTIPLPEFGKGMAFYGRLFAWTFDADGLTRILTTRGSRSASTPAKLLIFPPSIFASTMPKDMLRKI